MQKDWIISKQHELKEAGGRRFQREGSATENDLDLTIVVLVRGTKSSCLPGSVENEGMRQMSEVGWRHRDI